MLPIQNVVDEHDRSEILRHFHEHELEGGHAGQKRMLAKIRSSYKWPNMTRDVKSFVRNCLKCKINKPKASNREFQAITDTPSKPFQSLIIDTIGPFPSTVNQAKYAVTIIYDFSKYLIIVPIPNKEAATVARVLFERCILVYGPVNSIRSDLGTEYVNAVMKSLLAMLNIRQDTSTAYHHESVGTVERSHKTLNEYLRNYITENVKEWHKLIIYFAFCYSTTPNTSIDLFTPFELVFGRPSINLYNIVKNKPIQQSLVSPAEYVKEVRKNLEFAFNKAKDFMELAKLKNKISKDAQAKPLAVAVGEEILLLNEVRNKFDPFYKEGYIITKLLDKGNVEIKNKNNKKFVVHKNRLRKP